METDAAGWDPLRHIDNYCERIDPSFWAEPVNAITNAAFLLAALIAWREAKRLDRVEWATASLIALIAIIGLGSFLFHTFANAWSVMADVIPIQLAILVYFYLVPVRFYDLPPWAGALALGASIFVIYLLGTGLAAAFGTMNGSVGYLATALTLAAMGAGLWVRGHPAGTGILVGMAIFAVSLTFRTVDMTVCGGFPLGTHFLWHTLNGVTLGWLALVLIRHGPPREKAV
jgi:hypothetical protein